jgi:hypothetical protein
MFISHAHQRFKIHTGGRIQDAVLTIYCNRLTDPQKMNMKPRMFNSVLKKWSDIPAALHVNQSTHLALDVGETCITDKTTQFDAII